MLRSCLRTILLLLNSLLGNILFSVLADARGCFDLKKKRDCHIWFRFRLLVLVQVVVCIQPLDLMDKPPHTHAFEWDLLICRGWCRVRVWTTPHHTIDFKSFIVGSKTMGTLVDSKMIVSRLFNQ